MCVLIPLHLQRNLDLYFQHVVICPSPPWKHTSCQPRLATYLTCLTELQALSGALAMQTSAPLQEGEGRKTSWWMVRGERQPSASQGENLVE